MQALSVHETVPFLEHVLCRDNKINTHEHDYIEHAMLLEHYIAEFFSSFSIWQCTCICVWYSL